MSRDDESEEEAVRDANRAFYAAIEHADVDRMKGVWSSEPGITCVHPSSPMLAGPADVFESFRILLEDMSSWQFAVEEQSMEIRGDVAFVICVERLAIPDETGDEQETRADGDEGEPGAGGHEGGDADLDEGAGDGRAGEAEETGGAAPDELDAAFEAPSAMTETSSARAEAARGHVTAVMEAARARPGAIEVEEPLDEDEDGDDEDPDEDEGHRALVATHVFRKEGGAWRLVHRHASPFADDEPAWWHRRPSQGPSN